MANLFMFYVRDGITAWYKKDTYTALIFKWWHRELCSKGVLPYQVFGQFRLRMCLSWSWFWFVAALSGPTRSKIWKLIFILANPQKSIWHKIQILKKKKKTCHGNSTEIFTDNTRSPQSRGALEWGLCLLLADVFVPTGWVAYALDTHCGNPERQKQRVNTPVRQGTTGIQQVSQPRPICVASIKGGELVGKGG